MCLLCSLCLVATLMSMCALWLVPVMCVCDLFRWCVCVCALHKGTSRRDASICLTWLLHTHLSVIYDSFTHIYLLYYCPCAQLKQRAPESVNLFWSMCIYSVVVVRKGATARVHLHTYIHVHMQYGVAATSRLLKMVGLFCKRDL